FFSSRRRHTRSKRDWSSDVCSSDLHQQGEQFRVLDPPSLPERPSFPNPPLFGLGGLGVGLAFGVAMAHFLELHDKSLRTRRDVRSEERRVGKESRCRGGRDGCKKKR